MNCPEEVANAVLEIMRRGLVRARAAGWSKDSEQAAVEADHIHNLPSLLAVFSMDKLRYYVEGEIPCFTKRAGGVEEFEPYWEQLADYLENQSGQ